jgi:hypothetical protein
MSAAVNSTDGKANTHVSFARVPGSEVRHIWGFHMKTVFLAATSWLR